MIVESSLGPCQNAGSDSEAGLSGLGSENRRVSQSQEALLLLVHGPHFEERSLSVGELGH